MSSPGNPKLGGGVNGRLTSAVNRSLILASSAVVAAGIFILDLSMPLGVAGGVPYVILGMVQNKGILGNN